MAENIGDEELRLYREDLIERRLADLRARPRRPLIYLDAPTRDEILQHRATLIQEGRPLEHLDEPQPQSERYARMLHTLSRPGSRVGIGSNELNTIYGTPEQRNAYRLNEARRVAAIRQRAQRQQPVQQRPMVLQAQVQGVAFDIHDAFDNIDKESLQHFFERTTGVLGELPHPFINYIDTTMKSFINQLDESEKPTVTGQYTNVYNRLLDVNFRGKDYTKLVYYALEYVKHQPTPFQTLYVSSFTDECTTAYRSGNGMSCTKGIIERFVTILTTAITVDSENSEYKTLKLIIKPNLIDTEIGDYVSYFYSKSKAQLLQIMRARGKENVKQNNINSMSNMNKTNVRGQLKDYVYQQVLEKYEGLRGTPMYDTIQEKILQKVNEYESADFFDADSVFALPIQGGRRKGHHKAKKTHRKRASSRKRKHTRKRV